MSTLITPTSSITDSVCTVLNNLSRLFGPAVRLTLVARHQSDEKGYAVFSGEKSLEKVIEALQQELKTQKGQIDFTAQQKPSNEP